MPYLRPGATPPKRGKGATLSAKMKAFLDHYLADPRRNGSEAVIKAGYVTKNRNRMATELLRHPLVKAEIDKRDETRREKMEFNADFLLNKLMVIITDPDNKVIDQLRAIELAGKSIALWKERQEISGPDGEAIQMEQRLKEDVDAFTSRVASLVERRGAAEVFEFPVRKGKS